MVTLLQLINHVGDDFDVSRMEISALKTSLALDSQKNSKIKNYSKKIREQRSNVRGACRIIGGNSTSHFCTIESHGNDSKTRKLGALWTETERRWKTIFHLRTADSKRTEKRFFATDCDWRWEVIFYDNSKKKKYYARSIVAIDLNINGRTFMVRRSCSVSSGTKRVLFTMSCWNLAIPLRAIGIGYNWFVWAVHCEKNDRNTSKDMIKLFFFNARLQLR